MRTIYKSTIGVIKIIFITIVSIEINTTYGQLIARVDGQAWASGVIQCPSPSKLYGAPGQQEVFEAHVVETLSSICQEAVLPQLTPTVAITVPGTAYAICNSGDVLETITVPATETITRTVSEIMTPYGCCCSPNINVYSYYPAPSLLNQLGGGVTTNGAVPNVDPAATAVGNQDFQGPAVCVVGGSNNTAFGFNGSRNCQIQQTPNIAESIINLLYQTSIPLTMVSALYLFIYL